MPTTTNFGWTTPADTDLVKDGALAIRTLGNGVDTSLVDLKGGTTGQALTKATNTDLDYSWTDIIPASNTFFAGKNKIINGDFRINQRGFTSTTTSASYGMDRWRFVAAGGTTTFSIQAFTPATAPVAGYEGTNFARLVTTSQSASSDRAFFQQRIESVRTFANQTATFSFWAKAASGTPKMMVNLTQVFGTSGSAAAGVSSATQNISTSWTRYSFTLAVPSISGKTIGGGDDHLALNIYVSDGGDYGTGVGAQNNTFDIWGVQAEAGSVATAFTTATGTLAGELAACQRYYWRQSIQATPARFALGMANSTTAAVFIIHFPVQMRTAPTALEQSGTAGDYSVVSSGTTITNCSAVPTFGTASTNVGDVTFTVASGLTAGQALTARPVNTNAYLGWSAEL